MMSSGSGAEPAWFLDILSDRVPAMSGVLRLGFAVAFCTRPAGFPNTSDLISCALRLVEELTLEEDDDSGAS